MIAKDSKSYPYLAVAQYYNIPYAEVLQYANECKVLYHPPYRDWKAEVWLLEKSK